MKLCKKSLSIILAAVILISVVTVVTWGVVANDVPALDESKPNIRITADKEALKAGETAKLTFSVNNNPGFWAVKLTCKLDSGLSVLTDGKDEKGFTKVKYEVGEDFKKYVTVSPADNKELTYLYSNSNIGFNTVKNGTLFSIWVKVDEAAEDGEYKVKFTDYSIIDNNKSEVEFTFGGISLIVGDNSVVETTTTTTIETTTVTEEPTTTPSSTTEPSEETTTLPEITTTLPEITTVPTGIIVPTAPSVDPTTAPTTAINPTQPTTKKPVPAVLMNTKAKAKLKLTPYKKALKIKVSKTVKNASGYQISLSKNKKFKKATVKLTAKKTLKITKLKKSTKYYVRVRPYQNVNGKRVFGAWSNIYTKKTK